MRFAALALCCACGGGSAEPVVDVVGVRATGDPGAYTVFVELRSDETGCDRYADWWEILSTDGELVYRRILDHPHLDEQPFERSGGPVDVQAGDELVVRGHLSPGGYVGQPMRGSVAAGFTTWDASPGWAAAAESLAPQPVGCLF